MKKWLLLFVSFMLPLSFLVGCGGGEDDAPIDQPGTEQEMQNDEMDDANENTGPAAPDNGNGTDNRTDDGAGIGDDTDDDTRAEENNGNGDDAEMNNNLDDEEN